MSMNGNSRAINGSAGDNTQPAKPTKAPLRSESTKPTLRTSSTAGTYVGSAGGLGSAGVGSTGPSARQSALSNASGTSRAGRTSLTGQASAAGGGITGPNPRTTSATVLGSSRLAGTASATRSAALQQRSDSHVNSAGAVTPSSTTPITPVDRYLQTNALYGGNESSMTPSVRRRDYTPSLSPELEQLSQAASGKAAALPTKAEAGTPGAMEVQQVPWVHPNELAASKVPKNYLPTTGDLFALPDQRTLQVPQSVAVHGTQLVCPAWNQSRPWVSGSWPMQYPAEFLKEAGASTAADSVRPLRQLSALSSAEQDAALVDDLLTVFMGQAGEYIVHHMVEGPKWPRVAFTVSGVTELSLVEQVERLLPLCEYAFTIKRFVETRSRIEHPMVVQALAAAMRKLQEEWWLLVVQLEHQQLLGQLSLAGLVYYCQAPAASLELLATIAGEASDSTYLTSAGLLNLLAAKQQALAGDRAGQLLIAQLLEAAAEPYFGILRQWLCWGLLDDPYNEFMIKEDTEVERNSVRQDGQPAYWTQRYRFRGAVTPSSSGAAEYDVPGFLASSKEAILVTGKYLNVIRQCGQTVPSCPQSTLDKLKYNASGGTGSPGFLAGIQEALSAAAGALLTLMAGPQGRLMSWLHSLKHFFLMDQGDMLVHLLEQPELHASPSHLAPHRLQALIDTALRSSSVAASPHIDVVGEGVLSGVMDKRSILKLVTAATCSMEGAGQVAAGGSMFDQDQQGSSTSCLEMLLLTVKLSWPITLVVSKRQLLHYQVIFKQLLSLKWAERSLSQLWQVMRATKRLSKEDQVLFRPWHLLCSQLLHVVGEVLRFTTIDVLEPLWGDMEQQLGRAANMDEVIHLHDAFLSTALQRSLLTEGRLVRHINVLLSAAHELAKEANALTANDNTSCTTSSTTQQQQQGQRVVDNLKVMSMFCRNENRQDVLMRLQNSVDQVLMELVRDLDMHYQQLLTAAPAAAAASTSKTAAGLAGRLGGLSLGVQSSWNDSSRELASLHNLMQRLNWGCRMGSNSRQALLRGLPTAY